MIRPPRLTRELDGHSRHQAINCLFCALRSMIVWTSYGLVTTTCDELRTMSGCEGPGDIFVARDTYNMFAQRFSDVGLRLIELDIHSGKAPNLTIFRPFTELWGSVLPDPEQVALVIGQYAVVNDDAPELSGSPRYRGPHVELFYGIVGNGTIAIDGMRDGRRNLPKGRCIYPRPLARKFLANFSRDGAGAPYVGDGSAVFGNTRRAVKVLPPPTTPVHTDAEYMALRELYEDFVADTTDMAEAYSVYGKSVVALIADLPAGPTGIDALEADTGVVAKSE